MANPWAILMGLAAACLPVIIHWLTKPKPVRVPVSTLRFIRGAVAERRARYRLRDLLVLAFRTLAVLLFAAAIARPLMNTRQVVAQDSSAGVVRVVLLDCSQSMGARDRGVERFERARPIASQLLRYESSLQANLLLAAAAPNPIFGGATSNLGALRDGLKDAVVLPQRLKVQAALNEVAEVFAAANPDALMELHIISDFQRSNWATADFSVLPKTCETQLHATSTAQDSPNIALLKAETVGRIEFGRDAELAVTVANYSDSPRMVRAEVEVGSAVVPLQGLCAARSQITLNGRLPVKTAGWQSGEVRLQSADDSLAADDVIPLAFQVWPSAQITVLTRTGDARQKTAAWFVQQALQAGSTNAESLSIQDAADPDPEALQAADVVIVVRPGRLSSETIGVLKAMLQRGRGVLYVAGDQLDATNLNDLVAALDSSVRMPVEFLPLSKNRSGVKRFLTTVNRRTTPFSIFGDELSAAIGSLEFRGGLVTRPTQEGLADDVLGTLNDQSAFLTVTAAGRGRLAIINADLERSSLARTPVMVPLLSELIAKDLITTGAARTDFLSGEALTLQLNVGEESIPDLNVTVGDSPVATADQGQFRANSSGVVWNVGSAGKPAVYEVRRKGEIVEVAATSLPDEESDLRALSQEVFTDRLAGDRQLQFSAGMGDAFETQDVTWMWLAVGCMIFVLLEMFTLKLFRA